MNGRLATRLFPAALAAALFAVSGCGGGGGDATFSTSGFDAIEVGDSAASVTDAIGEPAATQELAPGGGEGLGSAVWVYCDGSRPYYLVVADDRVTEDELQLPDELRVNDSSCS